MVVANMSGDPLILALEAKVGRLTKWLRLIVEEADKQKRDRLAWMAGAALSDMEPSIGADGAARRAVLCLAALMGISNEALARLVGLDDVHRFGALRDIAQLHHLKARGDQP
jgi:hypothetical protein